MASKIDEPELATKAPESDAAQGSVIPGDTPAQAGASMGEHCVTDRPIPAGESTSGDMSKLGDVDVYISKPKDYPHAPSKLLLFLTGGTGIHSANNKLQADKFSNEGFLVVMPDMFQGDPAPNTATTDTNDYTESHPSLIEQVKLRAAETAKAFLIDMWLARHTPEKVLPVLHKVIEGAKEEFADAVASGGGIYAVGYCFGGKYVLLLAGGNHDPAPWGQAPTDEEHGPMVKEPAIKAGALAHGTMVTKEDIESLKSPVSMACVENDQLFPDDVREDGRKYLETHSIQHEIKVYTNVPHGETYGPIFLYSQNIDSIDCGGFAVLGQYDDPKIKEAQKWAFEQMLDWLKCH